MVLKIAQTLTKAHHEIFIKGAAGGPLYPINGWYKIYGIPAKIARPGLRECDLSRFTLTRPVLFMYDKPFWVLRASLWELEVLDRWGKQKNIPTNLLNWDNRTILVFIDGSYKNGEAG